MSAPPPPLPSLPVLHRPPCAIEELAFTAQCTKCDACIRACPVDAIRHADGVFGKASGTPVIEPAQAACAMCEGLACVEVCQAEGTGVLSPMLKAQMGTARIHPSRCLAFGEGGCSVCIEACPVEGALLESAGRPSVNPSLCTGCGICVQVCPTTPKAAAVVAIRERPPKPEQPQPE